MASGGAPAAFVDTAIKTNGPGPKEFDIVHASEAEMLADMAAVKAALLQKPRMLYRVPIHVQMQMLDIVREVVVKYPPNLEFVDEYVQRKMLPTIQDVILESPAVLKHLSERVQLSIFHSVAAAISGRDFSHSYFLKYVPESVQLKMLPALKKGLKKWPPCIEVLPERVQLRLCDEIGQLIVRYPGYLPHVAEGVQMQIIGYLARAAATHPSSYGDISKKIRDSAAFRAAYEPYMEGKNDL